MREIKFRAWIKKESRMAEVQNLSQNGKSIVVDDSDMDGAYNRHFGKEKYELMQYTGLKDKNGKEIYEGDIIAGYKGDFVHNVIGVVKYCGLSFVFEGTTEENRYEISGGKGNNYWRYTVTNSSVKELPEIEIIGNIYEHPHLINAKESTEKEG
jgi:uncharacterized phage protein (TIGR01671 family)